MHTSEMKKKNGFLSENAKKYVDNNIKCYKLRFALFSAFYDFDKQNKDYKLFCDFVNNQKLL